MVVACVWQTFVKQRIHREAVTQSENSERTRIGLILKAGRQAAEIHPPGIQK